jgi:hypothetical protein
MLIVDFASKFVVMERDTHLNVMMETMLMVMDAAKIVESNSDSHAMVALPTLLTHVAQPCHLL